MRGRAHQQVDGGCRTWRRAVVPLAVGWLLLATLLTGVPASAAGIEDYPDYQPATRCQPQAKPGTAYLGRWIVRRYGGSFGGISRSCTRRTVSSEHHEGRAFDWTLDVASSRDRERAARLLEDLRATDRRGNTDAMARRMGVMYVIWNDRIYSAWNGYAGERYLHSACRSRSRCSKTLRHRDHLHLSLTRAGGRGATSWFEGRLSTG